MQAGSDPAPQRRTPPHRRGVALGAVALVIVAGSAVNATVAWPALRIQVAASCAALAGAIALGDAWARAPEQVRKGCWRAAIVAMAAFGLSLA